MYNVSICDSERARGNNLENLIHCYFTAKKLKFRIKRFSTLCEISRNAEYTDIVFMNIDGEDVCGINSAEALLRKYPDVFLYILSDNSTLLDSAMDINAFRFFEIPVNTERLYASLDLIVDRSLPVEFVSGYFKVTLSETEIVCICTHGRRTYVITASGASYPTTMSIKEWVEKMRACKNFVSPHYSYIINLKYVSEFDGVAVIMHTKSGKKFKIYPSQRRISEFRNRFLAFKQA